MASKVYSKFTGKKSDGSVLKLRIEDFPKNRIEEALDFYEANYLNEDPLYIAAGVTKSKEAMSENRDMFKEMMNKPTCYAVMCILDDDSVDQPILGISMVELSSKKALESEIKEWSTQIKSKENLKLFELYGELYENNTTVVDKYTKDKYYDGRGVVVRSDLKDAGIATELMKTSKQLSKEEGVPLLAWVVTSENQKDADQAGWETAAEVSFSDLATKYGLAFENNPPTIKFMVANA